jgi:hypothetical protein
MPSDIYTLCSGDSFSSFLFSCLARERVTCNDMVCLTQQCTRAQYYGTVESYPASEKIVNVIVNH